MPGTINLSDKLHAVVLQDFFSLATIAALLYLVYSAYSELEKIR